MAAGWVRPLETVNVTREAAERDYGVVLREDFSLDIAATQRLRAERRAGA